MASSNQIANLKELVVLTWVVFFPVSSGQILIQDEAGFFSAWKRRILIVAPVLSFCRQTTCFFSVLQKLFADHQMIFIVNGSVLVINNQSSLQLFIAE